MSCCSARSYILALIAPALSDHFVISVFHSFRYRCAMSETNSIAFGLCVVSCAHRLPFFKCASLLRLSDFAVLPTAVESAGHPSAYKRTVVNVLMDSGVAHHKHSMHLRTKNSNEGSNSIGMTFKKLY